MEIDPQWFHTMETNPFHCSGHTQFHIVIDNCDAVQSTAENPNLRILSTPRRGAKYLHLKHSEKIELSGRIARQISGVSSSTKQNNKLHVSGTPGRSRVNYSPQSGNEYFRQHLPQVNNYTVRNEVHSNMYQADSQNTHRYSQDVSTSDDYPYGYSQDTSISSDNYPYGYSQDARISMDSYPYGFSQDSHYSSGPDYYTRDPHWGRYQNWT